MVKKRWMLYLMVVLISCGTNDSAKPRKRMITGNPGEIVVVMNNQHWNGAAGDLIKETFKTCYPLLPQPERIFNVSQYEEASFLELKKAHRNVIIVEIKDKLQHQKPHVDIVKEEKTWAEDQLVIKVGAKNVADFLSIFEQYTPTIFSMVNDAERERLQETQAYYKHDRMEEKFLEKYQLSVIVPEDFSSRKLGENFAWIHRERIKPTKNSQGKVNNHEIKQGIFIYTYPYTSDSTFTRDFLLAKRDSMLKKYVKGEFENSYMATETLIMPKVVETSYNGEYAMEMRGLYKFVNYFMGGPFVSLTMYDKVNERVVTVEGYVHAPNFDKREYLREVEAIVYSLKLPESK